jgi:hypothetical protein
MPCRPREETEVTITGSMTVSALGTVINPTVTINGQPYDVDATTQKRGVSAAPAAIAPLPFF